MPGTAQPSYVSGSVTAVPKTITSAPRWGWYRSLPGENSERLESRIVGPVSARRRDLDPADGNGLEVILDRPVPQVLSLPAGRETAFFCIGACFHRRQQVKEIALTVDGLRHRPIAQRMPRAGLFRKLHPKLPPGGVR